MNVRVSVIVAYTDFEGIKRVPYDIQLTDYFKDLESAEGYAQAVQLIMEKKEKEDKIAELLSNAYKGQLNKWRK